MRDAAVAALRELNEVVEKLRQPGGCPWDAAQTHASLRPYLLEETYELLEAIDSGDSTALREELGDVLLQVLMHCAIAMESEDGFDIGDVADGTKAKMIHRHPHVFGDTHVDDAAEVVVNWERLKSAEEKPRESILGGVPASLPALAYAQAVQKRPARLGWDEIDSVAGAVAELQAVTARLVAVTADVESGAQRVGQDWSVSEGEIRRSQDGSVSGAGDDSSPALLAEIEDGLGQVLWVLVALSRHLRLNPEDVLRVRTADFAHRFQRLESLARERGIDLHQAGRADWVELWRQA